MIVTDINKVSKADRKMTGTDNNAACDHWFDAVLCATGVASSSDGKNTLHAHLSEVCLTRSNSIDNYLC